jgi:hypothetical protein
MMYLLTWGRDLETVFLAAFEAIRIINLPV